MKRTDSVRKKHSTASLADEDQLKEVFANVVLGLWDVVNIITP